MDRKVVERLIRLAQAQVPFSFLEQSMKRTVMDLANKLKKMSEEGRKKYLRNELGTGDPEIIGVVENYILNPPSGNFPDVKGKKWSHAQVQKLVAEYWEKIMEYAKEHPEVKEKLEQTLMDVVDDIKFESNFEVILVVSLRSDPYALRASKLPLLATLILVGIDKGDIGKVKDPSVLKRVLEWYLEHQKMVDWKELRDLLLKVLKESGKRTEGVKKS